MAYGIAALAGHAAAEAIATQAPGMAMRQWAEVITGIEKAG
jgi:hypothetical protein